MILLILLTFGVLAFVVLALELAFRAVGLIFEAFRIIATFIWVVCTARKL